MYYNDDKKTYHYLKKLRRTVDRFNDKYPELHTVVNKNSLSINLKFFIKRNTTKEIFTNFSDSAFKGRIFGNNKVSMQQKINKTYTQNLINTLALKKDANRNMIEIIYRNDTLNNTKSAEFCTLLLHGYSNFNQNINIKAKKDDIFSFDLKKLHDGEGTIYVHSDHSRDLGY